MVSELGGVKDTEIIFFLPPSLSVFRLVLSESEAAQSCLTLCGPVQAPPSMGFSRQEHCSGLLFPSPGNLPDSGIKPRSPALQADALSSEPPALFSFPSLLPSPFAFLFFLNF